MVTIEISGLNLEKLLRECQSAGIRLHSLRRTKRRCIQVRIASGNRKEIEALCARFGWEIREIHAGVFERTARFCRARCMLFAGAALYLTMIAVSAQMVLDVQVTGAQEYVAQVRNYLKQEGVRPGSLKMSISPDALREGLLLHLPGLAHVSVRFEGSVLTAECHLAREGELLQKAGDGNHLIASRDGIVTKIAASSGTPLVREGDAVCAGQMLIKGEERDKQGNLNIVAAQGQVSARVWAQGRAASGIYRETAQETGRIRKRVSIHTPWFAHVVQPAQPFDEQNETIITEKIIDLFIPLFRKTEIYEEITLTRELRSRSDAASEAQGAAEKLAKKTGACGRLDS